MQCDFIYYECYHTMTTFLEDKKERSIRPILKINLQNQNHL